MKQAIFLICAFLVLFQVCSTVCDDTDSTTATDDETVATTSFRTLPGLRFLPRRNRPTNKHLLLNRRPSGTQSNSEPPQLDNLRGIINPPASQDTSGSPQLDNLRGIIDLPASQDTSGSVQIDNEEDTIVQTTPQITPANN